ncbi:MAG: hypothetical protein KDD73_04535 [Anaerolineales bacterium]|nr:hypothetical protein [Anaerolineales bacterium]MCB9128958.1 hypothetical protein [Ardenticatenales bacterium]MCB9172809.1 hypothetical protein [Ardenticatenales bacterium]
MSHAIVGEIPESGERLVKRSGLLDQQLLRNEEPRPLMIGEGWFKPRSLIPSLHPSSHGTSGEREKRALLGAKNLRWD